MLKKLLSKQLYFIIIFPNILVFIKTHSKQNPNSNINVNNCSLNQLRTSFTQIRDKIYELDYSLSWVIILDIIETMVEIMINIYIISITNNNLMRQHWSAYAFKSVTSAVKLIISCFINGFVYEESEKIYVVLDKLDVKHMSGSEFRELIMFKTISRETNFGFTIGGFAPLRKTTLIPVINK